MTQLEASLLPALKELSGSFNYGKLDLLARIGELNFRLENGVLVCDNWYDFSTENPHGDCEELSTKARRLIREQFSEVEAKIVWGYEPKFFIPEVGIHSFLVVGESHILDPSLKRLTPIENSGYSFEYEDSKADKKRLGKVAIEFQEGVHIPLGINFKNNLIFYLSYNPSFSSQSAGFTSNGSSDILTLRTYRPFDVSSESPEYVEILSSELGIPRVERINWEISPAPKEIRTQAPYLELAYQLEMKARADLGR